MSTDRTTVEAALSAWEQRGATSLTIALMVDALYGVREATAPATTGGCGHRG